MPSTFPTTTFGASVERSEPSTNPSSSQGQTNTTLDPQSTSNTYGLSSKQNQNRFSGIDSSSNPSNPFSAFYQHPSTRSSLERAKADSRTHQPQTQQGQKDVEAQKQPPPAIVVTQQPSDGDLNSSLPASRNTSTDGGGSRLYASTSAGDKRPSIRTTYSGGSPWPTRRELEEKALLTKRQRMRQNWNCLSGLTQRQRLWTRVLIAAFVICAAVGIGVGVSFAVGGGVYKSNGQQTSIPNGNQN